MSAQVDINNSGLLERNSCVFGRERGIKVIAELREIRYEVISINAHW